MYLLWQWLWYWDMMLLNCWKDLHSSQQQNKQLDWSPGNYQCHTPDLQNIPSHYHNLHVPPDMEMLNYSSPSQSILQNKSKLENNWVPWLVLFGLIWLYYYINGMARVTSIFNTISPSWKSRSKRVVIAIWWKGDMQNILTGDNIPVSHHGISIIATVVSNNWIIFCATIKHFEMIHLPFCACLLYTSDAADE